MTGKRRIVLLKHFDYNYPVWEAQWASGARPGRLGPYGIEHLEQLGFELTWTQIVHAPFLKKQLPTKVRGRLERSPARRGLVNAVMSARRAANADVALAIFEDQVAFAGWLKQRRVRPYRDLPIAVLVCWLADRIDGMDTKERSRLARSLASVDVFLTFSEQSELLLKHFPFMESRLRRVDFGVDTDFFRPADIASRRSIPLLAAGRDYSRDYVTLLDAIRGTEHRLTIICGRNNLPAGVPTNVTVLEEVDPLTYGRLLSEAQVVITPTTAPAYPSGQTVVLEAMAVGCATITTDSPAMREYVTPNVDGLLVPRGDVRALRAALDRVATDPPLMNRLAATGQQRTREQFTHRRMWAQIAHAVEPLLDAQQRR